MAFDANLWQAVADSLQGQKGDPGATGNPGVKGDPGPAGPIGPVGAPGTAALGDALLDSFTGADPDAKLTAAMSHAAAQTYPPIIRLGSALYTFNTKGRRPFRGMAIEGPGSHHYNAADSGATAGRMSEIALTFDSSADGIGWFHATDAANQDREVSFSNLAIRDTSGVGGSHPSFLTQSATALGYQLLRIHHLTTSGLWSVLGTLTQTLAIQGCHFDGPWHVNNGWSTDFHIGGSDNVLWPEGCLLSSIAAQHPAAGASIYHLWCSTLSKSTIGPMYITNIGKWGGIRVSGPAYNGGGGGSNGGPITIYGMRCEGHNAGDPAFGNLIRVEGGIVRFTDSWIAYAMSNPAATLRSPVDAGAIHAAGGALVASGITYDHATSVAETVPMIYASGAAVVRVRDALVGTRGGKWTGKPRVRNATSSPGSVTIDDSVTVI